jgi:hypothetical protein
MSNDNSNEDSIKRFCTEAATTTKRQKIRLNPNAQKLILENATVNKIKGEIDHANAFLLRSFRLLLQMEIEDT